MVFDRGPLSQTVRLHSHPQVSKELVVRQIWVFDCARCGGKFYLIAACPLADGALVCRRCFTDGDEHALQRCKTCGRMLPATEFKREFLELPDLDPEMQELLREVRTVAADSGRNETIECTSCRAKQNGLSSARCQHCGQAFESKRSHARYCSSSCRQSAYRERRQADVAGAGSPAHNAAGPPKRDTGGPCAGRGNFH
jgi:hypothetical protein